MTQINEAARLVGHFSHSQARRRSNEICLEMSETGHINGPWGSVFCSLTSSVKAMRDGLKPKLNDYNASMMTCRTSVRNEAPEWCHQALNG